MSAWHASGLPLAEAVLVGAGSGLVGALALMHRRIFFAEAVSHATFPGAVIGVVFAAALAPAYMTEFLFLGALVGCVLLAAAMALLARVPGMTSQSAAGVVLASGFGLGYFAATWFKPLPVRVDSFLTGSVLTANATDVTAAGGVFALALFSLWAFGPRLVAAAFSPTLVSPRQRLLLDATVLTLICLAIVAAIPAVGTIVSIALIAAPPAIVRPWVRSPRALLCASPCVGAVMGLGGLGLAQAWGLSAGGMIAVCAGCVFAASVGASRLVR